MAEQMILKIVLFVYTVIVFDSMFKSSQQKQKQQHLIRAIQRKCKAESSLEFK